MQGLGVGGLSGWDARDGRPICDGTEQSQKILVLRFLEMWLWLQEFHFDQSFDYMTYAKKCLEKNVVELVNITTATWVRHRLCLVFH